MSLDRRIWQITYPIFLGLLAQNIINVTDTAFLGRVGEVALGAAGMGGLYYICVFTIAFGFSTGAQILIARRNGEQRYHTIGPLLIQGSLFMLVLSLLFILFSRFFSGDIMRLLISSDEVWQATQDFLTYRIWGFFFIGLSVMFRALYIGITRTKVLTLNALVMAVTNVFLDYALIFGHFGFPRLGIQGAAIASVMAEAISVLFFVVYTFVRVDYRKYGLNRFGRFRLDTLQQILSISVFTMLQYFISLTTYFMLFVVVEHLGVRALAIANIVRSLYMILLIPINSLSMTANTLVSNTIGEGHTDQVIAVIRRVALWSVSIMAIVLLCVVLFPTGILAVYTNDAALIAESIPSVYVIAAALVLSSFAFVVFNGVTGTGNTQASLVIEMTTLVFYALFIYWSGRIMRYPVAVCFGAEIIYYVGLLSLSVFYLRRAKWQNKRI